ncbi:DUF1080 domain-containing protein [Spirosoma taeanense]|uniref:DUF1080 domain-containing protein n=1 Tax=Spirosoma taeanense TaxID=2735870 RepID=A0A6M5Y5P4_9BACT|nr:DUF1080 domain-containing protein [Spirosoma taeanense]QJW89788.1 DUF1080 domain-containing protein [Spirosoma taeanense]
MTLPKNARIRLAGIVCSLIGFGPFATATPYLSTDTLATSRQDTGWRQLFNGTDLSGWRHVGKGSMFVENGLIRGKGGLGLLYWTNEKFGNCTIRVVYRMQKENSNSGVFIRIPIEPREEWMPVFYGYEVQIDNHPETSGEDDYHVTGTLYSLTKPLAKPGKPGPQWNTMEITLDGPRTIVVVNGVKVTDYREGDPTPARKFDFEPFPGRRPDSGYIGLQNHGDDDVVYFKDDVVYFKEVSVKPLSAH